MASPLSELTGSKAMAQDDEFKLFPLKSGPHFSGAGKSSGASGIIFTGYTGEASFDSDPYSCCGSYTLRNSVHAAIAGMTSDGCTVFALKSVIDQRPCLAVGGFDRSGKPFELSNAQFDRVTAPLFNFANNVSPILGTEPALGVQMRNGNSTYGFQYNARSERYIFNYNNRIANGYHSSGDPDFEMKSNVSVEHDGSRFTRFSAGSTVRDLDRSLSASVFQEQTQHGFDATVRNGDLYGSIGKTYMDNAQTRRLGLGYGPTSFHREDTTGGKITERLEHKMEEVTLEVSRTRDRGRPTEYVITFKFQL